MCAQMTDDKNVALHKENDVKVTAESFFASCHLDSRCSVFEVKAAGLREIQGSPTTLHM